MAKDWKDNKYGLESGYSALNEAEGMKYGLGGLLLALFVIAGIGAALWGLASLLR